MTQVFDRSAEDTGNIVHLEHVNLTVPDQLMATRFYISTLGLTRDPYLNTGADLMWVNAGATQFHLPQGPAQRLRGSVALVIPGRPALVQRLHDVVQGLQGTAFRFSEHPDCVEVVCPWGNRLRCFEPDGARFGGMRLGIAQIRLDVAPGCAAGIARFYQEVFRTNASIVEEPQGACVAQVQVGTGQTLAFAETAVPALPYDGHHIQIYVADFSGPHRRLKALGLLSEESSQHQFRFQDIVDPQTGALCFQFEHEVRSMTHPFYRRPLVNRDPAQTSRNYRPGADQFNP